MLKKIQQFLIHILGGYTEKEVQYNIELATKLLQEELSKHT